MVRVRLIYSLKSENLMMIECSIVITFPAIYITSYKKESEIFPDPYTSLYKRKTPKHGFARGSASQINYVPLGIYDNASYSFLVFLCFSSVSRLFLNKKGSYHMINCKFVNSESIISAYRPNT